MRLSLPLVLLGLSVVVAAACGGSVVGNNSSGSASGNGGTGTAISTAAISVTSTGVGASGTTATAAVTNTVSSTVGSSSAFSSTATGPWTMEATFPAPPQVQDGFGGLPGLVLTSPNIYGILFASDDPTVSGPLADFTMGIGSSAYWTAVTSEYGVGAATAKIITLNETLAPTIDDNTIQTWLASKFGTDPNFPAEPTTNDVYIIYYPSNITITLQGNESCVGGGFGGYHSWSQTSNNTPFAYAVVPRCQMQGAPLIDFTTGDASHELVEAATDPFPNSNNTAYVIPDFADIYWADALGGGEVGDLCAQQPQSFTTFPPFNYVVQRIWSNKAAAAGHDPCQPEPSGEVYYNAAPVLTDMVNYVIQNQSVPVRGVKIAVGKSATIPVDFYSDGPIAAWPAQGIDYSSIFMGGPALLTLNLNPPTGENGTKGSLDITVNEAGANNQEIFLILSSNDGNQTVNWWFGVVTN